MQGVLRLNGQDNQQVYEASRAARHTVGLQGSLGALEVTGGVLDWTGGGLHFGFENDHAAYTLQGKRKNRTHHPLTSSSFTFNADESGRRHQGFAVEEVPSNMAPPSAKVSASRPSSLC